MNLHAKDTSLPCCCSWTHPQNFHLKQNRGRIPAAWLEPRAIVLEPLLTGVARWRGPPIRSLKAEVRRYLDSPKVACNSRVAPAGVRVDTRGVQMATRQRLKQFTYPYARPREPTPRQRARRASPAPCDMNRVLQLAPGLVRAKARRKGGYQMC